MTATAAASQLTFAEQLGAGLRVVEAFRAGGAEGYSQFAACLGPLLEALGWTGRARHVAEAVPHYIENIGIDEFRDTLANLNLRTFPIRIRQNELNPGLLPCLFVPDKGSVRVVLSKEDDGYRVYDGFSRTIRLEPDERLKGTAYVVRPAEDEAIGQRDDALWLAEIVSRFRHILLQLLVATLAINVLSIAMPVFMMSIYDVVIPSGSVEQLYLLVLGVGFAIGQELLFRKLRSRIMAHTAGRIDYVIGTAGFRQVLMLPLSMTENEPLGAQVSHLQEFESIREFFAGPLGETFIDLPFVFLFLTVIALLSGWLVLVPVVTALILLIATLIASPMIKRTFARSSRTQTEKQRFLIEAVSGMRAIKLAGAERVWLDRFRQISAASAIEEFRISMVNQTVQTFGRVVMMGAGVAVVGFGANMAMNGTLTIGALVATMALGWRALGPFQSSLVLLNRWTQIRSSLRQINHLMRLKPERASGKIPALRTYRGSITFIGVGYRHTPESDPALNGVTFKIEAGEVAAITGPNGAGKTTVVNLASGLYRPQVGAVLIDGIDIRQMDSIDIRQTIGVVSQISELLYGTVSQNLRLSVPWATDQELRKAARAADVHDAIMGLPEGYETRLTEQVVSELPEGFKQKLCIARALLREPPVLIFDEPGQMLDERGDNAFIKTVQSLRGRCTIIIVTHRPSHMRIADRLIVLKEGRLQYNGDSSEALDAMKGQLP